MKPSRFLFYLLLVICALNTTHNAVYNQCILFINQELLGSDFQIKLTLSLYFCAIFFVRCVVGLVADNCSGRQCILITLWVAFFGHLMACFANGMPLLIGARFIQGLGLGGGQVMGLVLLMQLFSTRGRASIVASEQVIFSIASVVLPTLGHIVSLKISWRLIYILYLALTCCAIFYFYIFQHRETPVALPVDPVNEAEEAEQKHGVLKSRFLIPTVMACFSISGFCLWGSYCSLLVRHYQIDPHYLLWYQLIPIIPYCLGSMLLKRFTVHASSIAVYKRIFFLQGSALVAILSLFIWNKGHGGFKFALLLPIILHNIAGSFLRPLMQAKALDAVPVHKIGSASSFISICQVGINAIFSIFINCIPEFLPAFITVQLTINLSILLYLSYQGLTYKKHTLQSGSAV